MWKNLIKRLHYASLVGLAGGIVVSLVLADTNDATSPSAAASMHAAIALICSALIVPSMVVMLLTGMLLVVAQPRLIGARWVWAKAVLGVVTGAVTLRALQPAVIAAASMSATGALGEAAPGPLANVVAIESAAAWWTLGLVLVALVVAVWRPRFGPPAPRAGEGE